MENDTRKDFDVAVPLNKPIWVTEFIKLDEFEYSAEYSLSNPPKHFIRINGVNKGFWTIDNIYKYLSTKEESKQ